MKTKLFILAMSCIFWASCRSSKTATFSQNNVQKEGKGDMPASKKASAVISAARKFTGTTYKYGGMDRKGMDCSGLVCNAFKEIDVQLPHQAAEMSHLGKSIKMEDLEPGDLVFMGPSKGSKKVTHVGIVTSVSQEKILFIHASTKRGVVEENLLEKWYEPLFIKGGRLF